MAKTVPVYFRISEQDHKRLDIAAEANSRSRSSQVLYYVKLGLAAEIEAFPSRFKEGMMDVTIRAEHPPNIDQIRAAFTLTGGEIFAWDGIIYNPSNGPVSPSLVKHEKVHFRQQGAIGGPEIWWRRYIADPAFRLDQEMEAHIAEYRAYSERHGRKQRRQCLAALGKRLASPMYGGMISKRAAMARIKSAVSIPNAP